MQVPPVPPPIVTAAVPQELVTKAVPSPQAAPPLVPRAVEPSPKSENFNVVGKKKEEQKGNRRKSKDEPEDADKKDDHAVNISI